MNQRADETPKRISSTLIRKKKLILILSKPKLAPQNLQLELRKQRNKQKDIEKTIN